MQPDRGHQGEEDAWRAIVDNFGDRATLDDVEPDTDERVGGPDPVVHVEPAPQRTAPEVEDPDRFVPPPPPPLPTVSADRLAAWVGLFGAPAVLLVCVVLGLHLPPLIAYLLVGAFIGGFIYLVVTMSSGPDDPYDDGARV